MKYKTSELTGGRLDQAVAQAMGYLYDKQLDKDFLVVALDPTIPPLPPETVRRSACLIIVDEYGKPYTPGSAWAAGSSASGSTRSFCPSSEWVHGGPIIDREGIAVVPVCGAMFHRDTFRTENTKYWAARLGGSGANGLTPLVAAMRVFVGAKIGAEVDL